MELIRTKNEHRIAKEFFLDYTNGTDVSRKLYPHANKKMGPVSDNFRKWHKADYIEDSKQPIKKKMTKGKNKGKSYTQRIRRFRLNLNPFWEYSDKKMGKNKFNLIEKEIISFIFSFNESRTWACSKTNLFEGITSFLTRIFIYRELLETDILGIKFLNGFFIRNKRYLKKFKDPEKQYKEFHKKVIKYGNFLINKTRILSNADMKGFNVWEIKDIPSNKYKDVPFSIPKHYPISKKEELLKRWKIVFYEKRALTFDELLRFRFEEGKG